MSNIYFYSSDIVCKICFCLGMRSRLHLHRRQHKSVIKYQRSENSNLLVHRKKPKLSNGSPDSHQAQVMSQNRPRVLVRKIDPTLSPPTLLVQLTISKITHPKNFTVWLQELLPQQFRHLSLAKIMLYESKQTHLASKSSRDRGSPTDVLFSASGTLCDGGSFAVVSSLDKLQMVVVPGKHEETAEHVGLDVHEMLDTFHSSNAFRYDARLYKKGTVLLECESGNVIELSDLTSLECKQVFLNSY